MAGEYDMFENLGLRNMLATRFAVNLYEGNEDKTDLELFEHIEGNLECQIKELDESGSKIKDKELLVKYTGRLKDHLLPNLKMVRKAVRELKDGATWDKYDRDYYSIFAGSAMAELVHIRTHVIAKDYQKSKL